MDDPDQDILSDFREGMASWASAVEAHKQAPPDENFAARLSALSKGATEAARVCREAHAAGFEWPPARKADSEPPYELRPGTGRRGPEELWQRFDQSTTRLGTMAAGTNMLEVARPYESWQRSPGGSPRLLRQKIARVAPGKRQPAEWWPMP